MKLSAGIKLPQITWYFYEYFLMLLGVVKTFCYFVCPVGIRREMYEPLYSFYFIFLQWAKREIVELSVLSSWKEMVKGQIEERISKLKQNFKQPTGKVLQNVDVKACLSDLHNKNVFVPADKAPNNIIIICKRYYI